MYCSKCGVENTNNEKFCKNCGCILEVQNNNLNNNILNNDASVNNFQTNNYNIQNEQSTMNEQQLNKIVNSNTKKYAIISILVGIGGIIFAFVVGMSLWLSLILGGLGFEMARRGKAENKLLSTIGYVANGILVAIGIIIYISLVLGIIE